MLADILVLGAGPAGIAISMLMARRGYSVEILDPAFFPRKKICGEFLNPQAVRWIEEQKLLSSLQNIQPFPVHGMKIHDIEGRSFTGRYSANQKENEITGYAVMREAFDTFMLARARDEGVKIQEGFRALSLLFNDSGVHGVEGVDPDGKRFERNAQILIGADGRNNLIGRSFGWVRPIRGLKKYAFQTYMDNVPKLSNFGEVHLVRDGYIGIAPLSATLANIALVIDESVHPGGDADPAKYLIKRIRESSLAQRLGNLMPTGGVMTAGPLAFETKRTSGHRTMLVGDTCGFIDPFTGEGINYAFLSANLAAEVLHHAFQTSSFEDRTLQAYDQKRRQVFSRKWMMSRFLQLAIGHPKLAQSLVRRFSRKQELANTIVGAVGSAVPVETVWNLRFLCKLVFA
jgi:flavin-dependent dehydrogenase